MEINNDLPAMEIIAEYLALAGLSECEINSLLARFLEEEDMIRNK